jgi:hypothetical protein
MVRWANLIRDVIVKIRILLAASILIFHSISNAALITPGDKLTFDFDFSGYPAQPPYDTFYWGFNNFIGGGVDPNANFFEEDV